MMTSEIKLGEYDRMIDWLLEFVVEPDEFPNEGDRQWWNEKLHAIITRE